MKIKKLVRDKIPELIQQTGKRCSTLQLDAKAHYIALIEKLKEEMQEFENAQNEQEWLEELADVQEVIHALLKLKGYYPSTLETARLKKRNERGGFEKGLFLETIE